jgi:16S rRNA (uracil1498-N3)-methyltransferase
MSNLRFYSPEKIAVGTQVKLSDNVAIHATRVMRLNVGDTLFLFDGTGVDFECALVLVQRNATYVTVLSKQEVCNESPINITLLLGISAGDRMDIGIQKAVELGVNQIIPIKTERSVVKLDEEKARKRVEHWKNVVIAACEQSGRAVIPLVFGPISFSAWLQADRDKASDDANLNVESPSGQVTRILLNPVGAKKIKELARPNGEIQLLIGSEGGLSENEIALAAAHGFQSIILGARILRTETAPLAAIATMNTLWGDF